MTTLLQCEVCGTGITPGPLGDVCPVCLLREGHTEFLQLGGPGAMELGATAFQDRAGLPRDFGNYELLEEIAHGGMGIVYRARQRALNREVALKLLLAGAFASAEFVRRFQREAAAAASLRHPHIVGVYEVGEVDGQPFLAMEYVAGRTLAEMVREHPLPPRDAARYLQTVAEAVQHAHDRGLLHRDLKPSNVLVDLDDQPRVTDFGLAKQMDGSTDLTVTGQMLGSPNYLSPEAALGREQQLTPASDVYSLGATLYHLLTGRPPLLAGSLAETLVRVREETAIAPRLLNPAIPRDLETICLKCLEKEPARRYATAREFADELGRWLRGEPIRARAAAPAERVLKWARRYPTRAALVGTVMLAVVAVTGASLWFNIRLTTARNESEKNRRLSETNRLAAEASAAASHVRLVRMQVITGNRLVAEGDPLAAALWFAEALRAETATTANARAELPHRRRLAAAWAAAPRLVGLVGSRDLGMFPSPASLAAEQTNLPFHLEAAPDGGATVVRSDGTAVRFTDPEATGATSGSLPASADVSRVALSSTGRHLLVFARDGSQRVWGLATGLPLSAAFPDEGYGVAPQFTPDGRAWIRIRHEAGRWCIERRTLAAPGAEPLRRWVDSHLFAFRFDPEGRRLATAHWDGMVRLWSADTLEPVGAPLPHANAIGTLAFSPDGTRLATGGWGNEARVWSVPGGRLLTPALRHGTTVNQLGFSRDGRYLLVGDLNGAGRIWDLFLPAPVVLEGLTSGAQSLTVSPTGVIAAWDQERHGHFWIPTVVAGATVLRHQSVHTSGDGRLMHLDLSADGQLAAGAFSDGRLLLWRVDSGELRRTIPSGSNALTHVAFSPDGRWVATASTDGFARRHEAATGREAVPALHHGGELRQVVFSPDSRRIATRGTGRTVKLWDFETGETVGALPHDRDVAQVAFNPAGTRLLTSMSDGTSDGLSAQSWDAVTFRRVGQPMAHADGVPHARFFPDGTRVLTASEESEARVWNADDGTPHTPWIRCGRRILGTDVSPDGLVVATVDESGSLRLWDADTGELLSASAPDEAVQMAAFISADHLVSGAFHGPLRVRALPAAAGPVDELLGLARLSMGDELDATGGLAPQSAPVQAELFARLRSADPERFAVHLFDPEWHRQELARAEAEKNAFAADFHRKALGRSGPAK